MQIDAPDVDDVDDITALWVELARDQRRHGSTLRAEANRSAIRQDIARHIVVGGIRVARRPEIVGFVMFDVQTDTYEQDVIRGVVRNLYVRPRMRGHGVGAELLETAESALADAGADVVTLETMASNAGARRFYQREGYRPHRVEYQKALESDTHSKEDG